MQALWLTSVFFYISLTCSASGEPFIFFIQIWALQKKFFKSFWLSAHLFFFFKLERLTRNFFCANFFFWAECFNFLYFLRWNGIGWTFFQWPHQIRLLSNWRPLTTDGVIFIYSFFLPVRISQMFATNLFMLTKCLNIHTGYR